MTASPFSTSRFQTLCRLAAYTMLGEYLLYLILGLLPFNAQPERLLGVIGSVLDTSTLPLIAVVLLFIGFSREVRTARWEWRLARAVRGLLLLVAVLYLLLIPANLALGIRIQGTGDRQLRDQEQLSLQQIQAFRVQLEQAAAGADLRRLLEAQPDLRQSLATAESPLGAQFATLPQQRGQALRLLDRIRDNLRATVLQQRSNAAGEFHKQQLRLSLLSLFNAIFFALGWLIWPAGLAPLPLKSDALDAD